MKRAAATAARRWRHERMRHPVAILAAAFGSVALFLGLAHAGLALWVRERADGPLPESVTPPPLVHAPDAPAASAPRYRWVDREAGVAEIPIERAMELLAVGGRDRQKDTQ